MRDLNPFLSEKKIQDAPLWLWLIFPPIMIAISLISRTTAPEFYKTYIEGELGLVENGTVLLLLIAVIFGVMSILKSRQVKIPLLTAWIFVQTIGCFYFMGEEASWGQHWFGWSADGIFTDHPRQETNIHNTNHWFDQKPKVAVELWTILGGIIAPLWLYFRGRKLNSKTGLLYWVWPTIVCFPTALIVTVIKNIERYRETVGVKLPIPFDIRFSEPQEYYFAVFFLIYMVSFYSRIKSRAETY